MDTERVLEVFFDNFSKDLKEIINEWVSTQWDDIISDPDTIWTHSKISNVIYTSLFELSKDKKWSNNITNDIVYNSVGFIHGLLEAKNIHEEFDIEKILPISLHKAILWQLQNGVISDYLNNQI